MSTSLVRITNTGRKALLKLPPRIADAARRHGSLVEELEDTCQKFELAKERRLEREKKVAEKKAMKNLLVTTSASAAS